MSIDKKTTATTEELFKRAYEIIGGLTPLKGHDCGQLCERSCCGGSEQTGMRLFPGEQSKLRVIENENGRFVVCGGSCDREERPLSCRIFPFYPTIDSKGKVRAVIDSRGLRICPLIAYCDNVRFDRRFVKAVERCGSLLSLDEKCREEMLLATEEIELVDALTQQ